MSSSSIYVLDNKDLLFRFPSQKTRDAFLDWFSEQGEQEYWEWMSTDDDRPDDYEDSRKGLSVGFDLSQVFAAKNGRGPDDAPAIIQCDL